MTSRLAYALFIAFAVWAGVAGCSNTGTSVTPSPTPGASISPAPDTLYVNDATSRTIRAYVNASKLSGSGVATRVYSTSDISRGDVVYDAASDTLWYPQAQQLPPTPPATFVERFGAASTIGVVPSPPAAPSSMTQLNNMEGTATYDKNHNYLYVALTTSNAIQVFTNATALTSGSTPAAQVTVSFTDGSVPNPHPQEIYYDSVNDRLFVADDAAVVAEFDNFGAGAGVTHTALANRQICGLFSPDGLAYNATTDTLFIGEETAKQVDVVQHASTVSSTCLTHTQTISGFSVGPLGLAYDTPRDILYVYDPTNIVVIGPGASSDAGSVGSIANVREFTDNVSSLDGFGLFVDTTH